MKIKTTTFLKVNLFLALSIVIASCTSTTVINSVPPGAKVYIDDQPAGTTPYTYADTKIVGSVTSIRLEKEGYAPYNTMMVRNEEVDVGAIIGGLICTVPFLWVMKYKPAHTFEMVPMSGYTPDDSYEAAESDENTQDL
ncbi:MAG: PEGA domain-containing protein [Bacteroidales bacterium]|nr:PEGA domain-containing protein [Bacteroidales bacterium]